MPDVNLKIIPALVISGKDQDVSVRQFDANPASAPDDRALLAFFDPVKNETFSKIMGIFTAKEVVAVAADPPSSAECEALVNGKLDTALPNTFKAGPALVMARTVMDGRWVPPQNPPAPGTVVFPYAFVVRSKDTNQDHKIDLPLRSNTVLVARFVIVVQKA